MINIFLLSMSSYTICTHLQPGDLIDIGYARVSTPDQHLRMQEDALKSADCKKIYTDIISGVKSKRPGLEQTLSYVPEGDTIVVWKLDRLGRSIQHLIQT